MARHLSLLAIFWIVMSGMRLLGSGGAFFAGRFMRRAAFPDLFTQFVPQFFPMIGGFLFLSALIGFLCGWGLLQKQPWARTLGIVLAALSLLDPPFGTALGIYTLWVLLPAQSEQEFSTLAPSR